MSNQGSVNPTRLQQNADVPGADAHPPRLGLAGDPLARDFVVDQYLPIVEALQERVLSCSPTISLTRSSESAILCDLIR